MNRKYLPALFMLTAAAVTCIITYVMKFTIIGKLVALLTVMVIFGTLGYVLKMALDSFDKQNHLRKLEEESNEESSENADGEGNEQDGKVSEQGAI